VNFAKPPFSTPINGDHVTRAIGHMISNAMQAYKVTGDTSILTDIKGYIRTYLRGSFNMTYGYHPQSAYDSCDETFMEGFLTRGLITYAEEIKNSDLAGIR